MEGSTILEKVDSRKYISLADKLAELEKIYCSSDEQSKAELRRAVINDYLCSEKANYGIHICGALRLKEAAPNLMSLLEDSTPKQDIEAAILALGDIGHEPAYFLIERYVSEHNHQALIALSNIDFQRTVPYINQLIGENSFFLTLECIFADMLERYGAETTLENLRYLKTDNPEKRRFILGALQSGAGGLPEAKKLLENVGKALG